MDLKLTVNEVGEECKRMQALEDVLDRRLRKVHCLTQEVYYYPEEDVVKIDVFSLQEGVNYGKDVYSLRCSLNDVDEQLVERVVYSVTFL